MVKKVFSVLVISLILIFSNNISAYSKTILKQNVSVEEIKDFQSHSYPKTSSIKVMKATINVLQDDCYFISQADSDLGYIFAVRGYDINDKSIDIKEEFECSKRFLKIKKLLPFFPSYSRTIATVQVTTEQDNTIIRSNFKKELYNLYDATVKSRNILDKEYYQMFYTKLDKELN